MTPMLNPIPDDYGSLLVQIVVDDAPAAIAFYEAAFGARELYRQLTADGARVAHCELLMSMSRFILHDEFPDGGLLSPRSLGGSPVTLMLYVADVDGFYDRAVAHGADPLSAPEDKFWGLRSAVITDPFGHRWLLAARIDDLSPEDILERAKLAAPEERQPMSRRR